MPGSVWLVLLLAASPHERFRDASELLRAGDYPKAIGVYRELAASGTESGSLYWNWAQAAAARGAPGEALWAYLRAREISPGDAAAAREIERLRQAANLDPAEIAPEPLAYFARVGRRFHLDVLAAVLLGLSVAFHGAARLVSIRRWPGRAAWVALAAGALAAGFPVAGSFARPTAVVIRRGATLLDAASPTAATTGALREGEVVPILGTSGDYVRIEDSSGARGWAHIEDVRTERCAPGEAKRSERVTP